MSAFRSQTAAESLRAFERSQQAPQLARAELPVASGCPLPVDNTPAPPVARRTEDQRAAARANGKKSRGPTTDAGKARSRTNATKHGMCCQSLATAPPDLRAEVEAEVDLLVRDLKPKNHAEQRLVEIAALSCARALRLETAERARAQQRARHARHQWIEERREQVDDLIARLVRGDGPARARRALLATAHGCRALARLLRREARRLALPGTTLDRQGPLRACELPGTPTHPDDLRGVLLKFWRGVYALEGEARRPLIEPALWSRIAEAPPDAETARTDVIAFLNDRAEALRRRGRRIWARRDADDLAEAPVRAAVDLSDDGRLIMRYLNEAARLKLATERALDALRRAEARRRREEEADAAAATAPNEPGGAQDVCQTLVASPQSPAGPSLAAPQAPRWDERGHSRPAPGSRGRRQRSHSRRLSERGRS